MNHQNNSKLYNNWNAIAPNGETILLLEKNYVQELKIMNELTDITGLDKVCPKL